MPEPSSPDRAAAARTRVAKLVFMGMALGSLLLGLAMYLLADALRMPADTARLVATVFILVGIGDALVLYFWDRLFTQPR
jgi:predicted alpha/beta-fold hydrolase